MYLVELAGALPVSLEDAAAGRGVQIEIDTPLRLLAFQRAGLSEKGDMDSGRRRKCESKGHKRRRKGWTRARLARRYQRAFSHTNTHTHTHTNTHSRTRTHTQKSV